MLVILIAECGTHAHEGNGIQDTLDSCGRFLCVRCFSVLKDAWHLYDQNSFCIKMPFLHRLACFRYSGPSG